MHRHLLPALLSAAALLLPPSLSQAQSHHLPHLLGLNTLVGTAPSNTAGSSLYNEAASEAHGQTLPAVCVPHGQTLFTPQTRRGEQKCVAPYYYNDSLFHGIRASHWIVGGCTQDYGSFTLTLPADQPLDHSREETHPHYYRLTLDDLDLELTALSHSAILRLSRNVPLDVVPNSDEGMGRVWRDSLRQVVFAENPVHRIYQGWGESAGFSGYIAVYYGQAPTYLIATSFTSAEAAYANLMAETDSLRLSFEQMQQACARQWLERFHTLCVDDPDSGRVCQFYGALYRASLLPREMSDCDGSYPRFASRGETGRADTPTYGDFSMWDIYRAQLPLLNLIDPVRSGQMMESLVRMYKEGKWLPIFPCWNSYTAAMIGDHAAAAIADAYIKGIRNFDAQTAYQALRKNAFHSPRRYSDYKNGMGRRALKSYLHYGYIPLEDSVPEAFHQREQTSRTLEYAFDDFCVAQMARALGHQRDYEILMKRSSNWRNVINPLTRYADGRHADGSWAERSDPHARLPFLTEGAPVHYTLYVPHDVPGLMKALGGADALETRLDSLFERGYYWHGNEPCHHIAYLYNACGRGDKTRQTVERILQTEYNDTPGGLCGNDDAGQMSAWYVFSSLGFYPLCPATTSYELAHPAFKRVTINPPAGRPFVIEQAAGPDDNPPRNLDHNDILNGGTITF